MTQYQSWYRSTDGHRQCDVGEGENLSKVMNQVEIQKHYNSPKVYHFQ
jgi:hypothetical protein